MSVGFDKLPRNLQLALYLPFADPDTAPAAGSITHDFAKPMDPTTLGREDWHTFTLTGGTISWGNLVTGQPYIDFTRATPDYLSCTNALTTDLGFTTETFSGGMWINADLMAAATKYALFNRADDSLDGWSFYFTEDVLTFTTYNAGPASQDTTSLTGKITTGTWYLVGFSRSATAVATIYVNGVDVTDTAGTHIDPAACTEVMYIGCDNTPGNGFDGKMVLPMIWAERALDSDEWYRVYLSQRKMLRL